MNNYLNEFENQELSYVGFWPRLGAQILDGLILIPLILPITFLNIISWKSISLLIIVAFISTAYKPFMEYKYGATLGKMIVKIKVTTITHQKPALNHIIIRNVFNLAIGLVNLIIEIYAFRDIAFSKVDSYSEYSDFLSINSQWNNYFTFITVGIYLIDAIFIWTDAKKRSLHDRLALTYVVRK